MSKSTSRSHHDEQKPSFQFDYELAYQSWYTEVGPPLVRVSLGGPKGHITVLATVDTGAYAIVVDATLVQPLGIDYTTGRRTTVGGTVGPGHSQMEGWIHPLVVSVDGLDWTAIVDVVVVPQYRCQYVLLGREGFLNQWRVCFREHFQTMYFSLEEK